MKEVFAPKTFASKTLASGAFAGAGEAVVPGTVTATWNPRTTDARILHPGGMSTIVWTPRVDRTRNQ